MSSLPEQLRSTAERADREQCLHSGWGIMDTAADEIERLQNTLRRWQLPLGVIESPEPNPMNTIAERRGWNHLAPTGHMTVTFNGIEYVVTRLAKIQCGWEP